MEQWEVKQPLGRCCGTGKDINPGEQYFAALVETQQGLQRQDFCAEYWQQNRPDVFCYWKTTLPHPDRKKQIFVNNEMLMAFFERLANESEPEKLNFRFVLTLILMRKRRLKYDSTTFESGSEIWRLKVAGENRFVQVTNPQLSEEQIEQLSSQLSEILQVEL